jgi:hypothetical protein
MSVLIMLSYYFYKETIFYFPNAIHSWTQTDRFALALGFIDNNFNLFKPQVFNLMTIGGITGVDLPIHEYLIAGIFKIFKTQNPSIFRLYILSLSLLGLFHIFQLSKRYTVSNFKGAIAAIFVFTCPVITYYQAGFVPSATAFSTAIIAYFYYFQYKKDKSIYNFYAAIALFSLSSMVRTPFNIFLFAVLLQQMLVYIHQSKIIKKEAFAFIFAYAAILAYNLYKIYLSKTYGSQFLSSLLPADNFENLKQIVISINEKWTFQYFTIYHYILIGISVLALIIHYILKKSFNQSTIEILIQAFLIITGSAIYFLLMSKQFVNHDYYFLDSFYLGFILIFIAGLKMLPFSNLFQKVTITILLFSLSIGGIFASMETQLIRYTTDILDRSELTRKNFQGAATFLDSLKIPRNAKILVIDAYSTNTPLLLMERKGFTVLHTNAEKIKTALNFDFDFVVMQDVFIPSDVVYHYPEILNTLKRIAGNGRISVFEKAKLNQQIDLYAFLGIKQEQIISEFYLSDNEWFMDFSQNFSLVVNQPESLSKKGYIDSSTDTGPMFELKLDKEKSFNKLLFEANLFTLKEGPEIKITTSIHSENNQTYYWNFPLSIKATGEWTKYQCLFSIPETRNENEILKCYLWNPDKSECYYDNIKITLYRD